MTLWRGGEPLILASQSSARQALLRAAGIDFVVLPASIDERAIQRQSGLMSPGDIARHLAEAKAIAVSAQHPGRYIIGADQTLALGRRTFNKPASLERAGEQLAALAGRTHELHSAVAVVRGGEVLFSDVPAARMTMRPLSAEAVAAYLAAAGGSVVESVGAYQLEGLGIHLFERIEGDHATILGLPLLPLLKFLRGAHLLAF